LKDKPAINGKVKEEPAKKPVAKSKDSTDAKVNNAKQSSDKKAAVDPKKVSSTDATKKAG
jgi:hypothetical protein